MCFRTARANAFFSATRGNAGDCSATPEGLRTVGGGPELTIGHWFTPGPCVRTGSVTDAARRTCEAWHGTCSTRAMRDSTSHPALTRAPQPVSRVIAVSARWHAQPETFTAVAMAKGATIGAGVANMTVTINRLATDAERDALLAAVKEGGTAAARTLLRGKANAGTLQLGSRPATIKYAYSRSTGSGRLLTLITADPIVLLGAGLPDAKPATGYDLGLVLLEVAASGPGKGEARAGGEGQGRRAGRDRDRGLQRRDRRAVERRQKVGGRCLCRGRRTSSIRCSERARSSSA